MKNNCPIKNYCNVHNCKYDMATCPNFWSCVDNVIQNKSKEEVEKIKKEIKEKMEV